MTDRSLLALLAGEDDPSARHRVLDLVAPLRDEGLVVRCEAIPSGLRARSRVLGLAAGHSVVLLQRRLMGLVSAQRLRREARRLVFDFDDALPFTDTSRGARRSRTRERRFGFLARSADLVVAGNEYLAGLAFQRGAREVLVLPTGLHPGAYPLAPPRSRGGAFRAGWIGSSSTLPYLEALAPVLNRAAAAEPRMRLAVLCDRSPRLTGFPVDFTPWSKEAEVPFLHSLDVGLAPLPEDPWTRGKCGLRILKYLACGVPVVAEATGVQPELLDSGRAGRLVYDDDGWLRALRAVGQEEDATRIMVEHGRTVVERRYSTIRLGRELARALVALCADVG